MTGKRRRFLSAREQCEMLAPWRRTAAPGGMPEGGFPPLNGKLPLQWKPVPHLPELWPGREAFRAEPGNHYTYFLDSPYGDFDPANPRRSWPDMWKLNHSGPDADGEWYNSPTSYHATRDEAVQAAAAHHVLGRDPLDHPGARRGEDYATTPEQDRAAKEYTHNLLNPPGAVDDDDFEWDDEDEDGAPSGVWTPPTYRERDHEHPNPGGMYGTPRERYLEDVYHGHLVDLDDHELIDAYEHQRTQPGFKGSDLEDTMWTAVGNRYEEWDQSDEKLEGDFNDEPAKSPIVDYFNKVHGCDEHMWTPPDLHEPHGNFGDHPEGWDPDDDQNPFDPRLIGASRMKASGLEWQPDTVIGGSDGVHERYETGTFSASGPNGKYTILPPNFYQGETDFNQWRLINPKGKMTSHPSRGHAEMAAQHNHDTGTPTTEFADRYYHPGEEEEEWEAEQKSQQPTWTPEAEWVKPGPHRLSIERHLVDEDYTPPDWVEQVFNHEVHPTGLHALRRLQEVAEAHGCEVEPYHSDEDGEHTRHYELAGPEPGEVQGCAKLDAVDDVREPLHGDLGEVDPGWDPDDDQDPFDPRLIGASRTAAMGELSWKPEGEGWLDHPDENDSIQSAQGDDDWQHTYHVLAPWRHDAMAVNGFGERVDSEQPHMWGLVHRFDPDNGFWDHAVTYHPTEDHAKGAAEHHHITGDAPGRWPGTVPHSDYDADHVESWPDIAENVDREREEQEEEEWDEDYENDGDHDDGKPRLSMPDISIKDRKNSLKWQKYLDGRELFYNGESTSTSEHSYDVKQEHGDKPNRTHLRGKFRVFWHKPYYSSANGQTAAPDGSFQEEHGGLNYHDTLEGALDWAEKHNQEHSWDPERDPFDPRTFGAARREERDE